MRASLFVVMDENNDVLYYKIVPNDQRVHMAKALGEIWSTPNRSIVTEAVYTDNPNSDKSMVEDEFKKHSRHAGKSIDVLQVTMPSFG